MAVKATELRKGQVIEKDGDLLLITDYDHRTPGNWRAIISVKTRSLKSGSAGAIRYGSGDMVEVAFLDRRKAEYLYRESNGNYVFMDQETYEQFELNGDVAAESMGFVRENGQVEVTFHDGAALSLELPPSVTLRVVEAEQAVKGNTTSGVKKEAVLETGMRLKVPMHIKVDEQIRVSTDTGEFQSRAKES